MNGTETERLWRRFDELAQIFKEGQDELKADIKEAHKEMDKKMDDWYTVLSNEKNHYTNTFATKFQAKLHYLLTLGSYAFAGSILAYFIHHLIK